MRLALLALGACWTGAVPAPQPPPPAPKSTTPTPAELTPKGLEGIWMSMPLDDFKRARPNATDNGMDSNLIEYYEEFEWEDAVPPHIVVASYDFGITEPHPLYEIRIAYQQSQYARAALDRYLHLGSVMPPTDSKDYRQSPIATINTIGFDIGVWVYGGRLWMVAPLPGTPRANDKFGERQ